MEILFPIERVHEYMTRRLSVVAITLLACQGESQRVGSAVSERRPTPSSESVRAMPDPPRADETVGSSPIPTHTTQLVTVVTDDWSSVAGTMQRYERTAGEPWRAIGEPWSTVVGTSGLGWGVGMHNATGDAWPGTEARKREGDGRAPAGVFGLTRSYGYAAEAPGGTEIPYRQLDASWVCVDDSESDRYNRVFDADGIRRTWSSAETMRRDDDLYRWLVVVDHNVEATPEAGSCIFLHLWSGPDDRGTQGCTAMNQGAMLTLMDWLDPAANPVLVQLPASAYRRHANAWALPPARPAR